MIGSPTPIRRLAHLLLRCDRSDPSLDGVSQGWRIPRDGRIVSWRALRLLHVLVLLVCSFCSVHQVSAAKVHVGLVNGTDIVKGGPLTNEEIREELILDDDTLEGDANEDSLYDPMQADPDCQADGDDADASCWNLPDSTVEELNDTATFDATSSYGGQDPDGGMDDQICSSSPETFPVDRHWGSDPNILRMRDKLRQSGSGVSDKNISNTGLRKNRRPPIFLMPGLASTRLVAWRYKSCPQHPLLSDIKVQDYVWLNINLIMQMGTIDVSCMSECLQLGRNQTDTDDLTKGCKLRPDEGLDAISSLSPGGIGSHFLVGGTNTVYAWLIQWLADNLGYDVSNIVGLPYDWRLSPDKMEERDGFLTLTRRRIEAAVQTNGKPGIMVAHSMGNLVFRYFLDWLRNELREESYKRYVKQAERRAKAMQKSGASDEFTGSFLPGWMSGVVSSFDELWSWVSDQAEASPSERHAQLWELAQTEGDSNWYEWIEMHIWTYVGLSAPMLGAVNPLRAVISGENMGIPVPDASARHMEVTFGSTHTVNPISTKGAFCDQHDFDEWDEEVQGPEKGHADSKLACLDDIVTEIEESGFDPWYDFPALKSLLKNRLDWDTDFPMISVAVEECLQEEKPPCQKNSTLKLGPKDAMSGNVFSEISKLWRERDDPMTIKRDQLRESFWDAKVSNILNRTWDRPLIKHIVMAYGVDIPTEVGYRYKKRIIAQEKMAEEYDDVPNLQAIIWEDPGGRLTEETRDTGKMRLTEIFVKKKNKRVNMGQGSHKHSGDGSVPYLSLAWAHTWLLHGIRAVRHSGGTDGGPLREVQISHRPLGAMEWIEGHSPKSIHVASEKKVEESDDTGTAHPHGTKYKPAMVKYHSAGTSRTTGIEYTTTVIEAIGVEHKETTRNYDILAACFTDILHKMHEDLEIV